MRVFRAVLICAALLATTAGTEAQQSEFVIIVHAENPLNELSREAASKLFLKKTDNWADGAAVAPVDQTERSATREAFSKAVHKRSVGAIKAFWQQQLFAARGIPPVEKGTDAEVLAFVRANPNAIGYVTAGSTLDAGIKTVRLNP
jgi:ABC-type phosphate transport system substrate-binding protein